MKTYDSKQMAQHIISIFARGREIGFAIVIDGEIYRYGVKTIRGEKKKSTLKKRVSQILLGLFTLVKEPSVIVVEQMDTGKNYGALAAVIPHVIAHFTSDIYPLMNMKLSEVKQVLCGNAGATHQELITAVTHQYPVLWPLTAEKKPHQVRYWQKVILAMALAMAARIRLETKTPAETN